jgi:phage terminase large subunit-like protein
MIERATDHINGILSGEIVSGKWIRLAMERHKKDLTRVGSPDFPYYFDENEAERVLNLYKLFRFSKGKESGQPFDIMPWFAALIYMAYGWRRVDGDGKRFRKIYCKVARGNAKTANLVTVGVIGFLFDNASDPEVYWIATKKDQAKIGWDRQRSMLKMLVADYPEIAPVVNIPNGHTSTKISRTDRLSWVTYLGRDSEAEDGASPYYVLADEIHAWDNDDLLNVMESGMVKVNDPMTWMITTAGYKPLGPNSQFLTACKNILSGITENDELLAFVYELDEGDDWRDENIWCKANPGLGISVSMTGLRTEYNKIKTQGTPKEIDFKVKNLNIEQAGSSGWVADEKWMKCADIPDLDALKNRECWGGLDLANTNDFNAFVLFFPPTETGKGVLIPYYWIPEDAVEQHRSRRPFVEQWVRDGYLRVTPGNVTDYEMIREDILEIVRPLYLQSIGFDKQLSSYLAPALVGDGIRMEVFPQTWQWMTPAAKHLEHMVYNANLEHGGNPVLRWNMANVSMQRSDRNDNYLPSKGKSAEKIDGIAATLNAVGQWLKERGEVQQGSYLFEDDLIMIG